MQLEAVISAPQQCVGTRIIVPAEVKRALHFTGYRGLRALDISVDGEVVFLHEHVPLYHLKQVVQTVSLVMRGVRKVHNELSLRCLRSFKMRLRVIAIPIL